MAFNGIIGLRTQLEILIIIKEVNFRIPEGISGVEVKLGALEALTKYFKKYFGIQTRLINVILFCRIDQAMEELRKSK